MPVVVNISSLIIVCQCVPVPGQMSESNRWIQWRSESTCTPGSHLRSCKRPLHPGHRGGLQSHQQVSHLLLSSPACLQMLRWSYYHGNTFFLPPPLSERSSWTSCTLWSSQMAPLWCMWAGRWTSGELCHRCSSKPWSIFTTATHLFIPHVLMLLCWSIFQEWPFTFPSRQISARKILHVHCRSALNKESLFEK